MKQQPEQATTTTKMKAGIVSKFGKPNDVLSVSDTIIDKPIADDKTLLIKVHSVSLSPGDYRNLLGDKTVVFNPKEWPYVPCGDVCGTVLEPIPKAFTNEFAVGDKVISTWDIIGQGGLAEYTKVDPKFTIKMPKKEGTTKMMSVHEGAALANSASHAFLIMKKADIKEGDRVLVLGGSGGVGTILIQMLKQKKVSYIATTSTADEDLMIKTLGADRVIDYTKEDWSQISEFKDNNKFDCIIDCAEGVKAWKKCNSVLKSCREGGRFVALVLNEWHIDGQRIHQIIFGLLLPPLGRQIFNIFRRTSPYYRMYVDSATKDTLTEVMSMVEKQNMKVILDANSPYEFTTDGVRDAFNHHIDRKGHGKIVIAID